ncbi:MAG: phage head closure protein [bacterium]
MTAGALRHRFVLKTVFETKDTFGAVVESVLTFATVWASVKPLLGRELLLAQQMQADVTHHVRMRYIAGVTPKMTGFLGVREFQILSVINPEERNRELVLVCKELV